MALVYCGCGETETRFIASQRSQRAPAGHRNAVQKPQLYIMYIIGTQSGPLKLCRRRLSCLTELEAADAPI